MNTSDIITDQKIKDFVKPRKIILIVLGCTLLVLAAIWFSFFYVHQQEKKKHMEITRKSISEIQEISEFCTANYLGEVMVHEKDGRTKELILIVRGKVRAGYDLTQMKTTIIDDTTVSILLPEPKILDVITNPSDIRTFVEKGKWSIERVTEAKNSARQKLLDLVEQEDLLGTAKENGEYQIEALFTAMGFINVEIRYPQKVKMKTMKDLMGDTINIFQLKLEKPADNTQSLTL